MVDSEVVDDSVDAGLYNSIALDPDGIPHIAYYDSDNSDLKYASRGEGYWSTGARDSAGETGAHCSIAVDSSGTPHFSYQYSYEVTYPMVGTVTLGELKYAGGTNGAPVTVDDTEGIMGAYTSMALNDSGAPRIGYQGETTSGTNLRYVAKNSGSWGSPVEVEAGGGGASLVLDSNGYPHISHVNGTELRYVHWNGSGWDSEVVEDYQIEDERTSIALDSNGYPHIVYVNVEGLRYVYWDGSEWNDELVHWINNGAVGASSPSLTLNSDDEAFISFHGSLWGDLAVVVAVRAGANDWSMPAWLLDETTPGGQTSITVDTNDILHVSFHDETTGDLGYAQVMEDSDGDWLPDWWEMKYFSDLDEDAAGDPDGDSITNNDEYWGGTDPTVPDEEEDTDGDGLSDGDEDSLGTDPFDPDTDGDGMPDGWEVQMGFNPTHVDGADDADGDLLTNAGEYENQTDPFDPDTDGDGQNDYEEVVITGMNPLDADSLLKLESLTFALGGFELKWLSATGRVYDLLSSTNLMEGFQPLQSDLPAGTGGFTVVTNVPGQSPMFYKVRVRLP